MTHLTAQEGQVIMTTQSSNRLSQALRIANMIRKRQTQKRYHDPAATAHLLGSEVDRAIQRARDALNENPRANGIKRWLRALVAEKNFRYARRQNGHE